MSAILFYSGMVNAQTGSKISTADSNWSTTGIYSGYQPSNEILKKRTSNSKHFLNANGSVTTQIGGLLHYQDQNGHYQDLDLSIKKTEGNYPFSNETNNIKSFFPGKAALAPVKMQVSATAQLSWWKNPSLQLTSNGQVVNTYAMNNNDAVVKGNSIFYHNVYPGMSEQFETSKSGLENSTIINSVANQIKSLPANALLEFSQTIELGNNDKVLVNGKSVSSSFTAPEFAISISGLAQSLQFNKVVIFDNAITKQEALYLVNAPKAKLSASDKANLLNHIYQSQYEAEFVNGDLKITYKLPASWVNKTNRAFPVTVDPTVTIGEITTGYFYGPMTHWYGFQRHADLYLQSEIGVYGIITAIEYYKTGTQSARTKPTKVYMRSTTANILTGTDAWNSPTYTGGLTPLFDGLTTQDETVGWKMIELTTAFDYSSGNLLVMVNDSYGGGGSAQYMAQTDIDVPGRQAFRRADSSDPGDSTPTAVEDKLQTIRITYQAEMPVLTSFSPETACSETGEVVITGTGFSGTTSVTIGGTPVTSFTVNSQTQITAIVGSGTTGIITVTNSLGSASSTNSLTVNMSPEVEAITGGTDEICIGQATPAFANATTGGTWSVTNGTGVATIDENGLVTGTTSGTVTVNYTVTNSTCATTVTKTLQVNALPPAITITPAAATLCAGTPVALTVSGSEVLGEFTIGDATTTTGTTEELSAFNNRRQNLTFQMVFTAAELNAAGFNVGNIAQLAFNITSNGSAPDNTNYKISIGATTQSAVTTAFITTPMTTVYGPAAYTHAPGWNSFVFTTPYFWDGASNIVVQVSHDGIDSIYNAETFFTSTTDDTVVFKYNVTGALTTGTISKKRFNTRFTFEYSLPVTWSPVTGLFTDEDGTIPYTAAMNALTVYAVPQADTTYVATITNNLDCDSTASVLVTIGEPSALPTAAATQNYTEGQTLADLLVTGENIQWYADANGENPLPLTTVLTDTTYYVSQTVTGGCESALVAVQATMSLATAGFDKANFAYYPNPVSNVLTLKYTKNISTVSVFNLLGQVISSQMVNATESQIDMSKFAAGAYLIKVTAEDATTTIKIVKN